MTNDSKWLELAAKAIREVSEGARELEITPDTRLVEELALDSLDLVAVFLRLQDDYGVEWNVDEALGFQTVQDLMCGLDEQLRNTCKVA